MNDNAILERDAKAVEAKHSVKFKNTKAIQAFCGALDKNLQILGDEFGLQLTRRGNIIEVHGDLTKVQKAMPHIDRLVQRVDSGNVIDPVKLSGLSKVNILDSTCIYLPMAEVRPRNENQRVWVDSLLKGELSIGVGPAGTGKTMLAVAAGVNLYLNGVVDRIIVSRPAVEAGERLGFLPGDMKDKVDPYLQPIYDALRDFLPAKKIQQMLADKTLEIAPLAFMRGRTLSNAFVLLDEAQNTTAMQMKMFLTRLGKGSRMAITGDNKQIDLPKGVTSGLIEAMHVLDGVQGIKVVQFTSQDVVRHPLVQRIVAAYEAKESELG